MRTRCSLAVNEANLEILWEAIPLLWLYIPLWLYIANQPYNFVAIFEKAIDE